MKTIHLFFDLKYYTHSSNSKPEFFDIGNRHILFPYYVPRDKINKKDFPKYIIPYIPPFVRCVAHNQMFESFTNEVVGVTAVYEIDIPKGVHPMGAKKIQWFEVINNISHPL